MAVSTTNAYTGPLAANGATTTFPFTFSVLSGADLTVVLRDADGVETVVSTDDYSVSLSGSTPSAGSVVFDTAPATGNNVWIYLAPAFTQETQFSDGHPFIASAVNDVNDRAALRDQVLRRDIGRALALPIGETPTELPGPSGRQGKFIAFDAGGAPIMSDGTGADAGLRTDLAADAGAVLIGTAYGLTLAEILALSAPLDSIYHYGYVADGLSHPLSGVTKFKGVSTVGWSLAQWQTAVPQVTALTNEIDAIAVQAWFNDRSTGGKLILPVGQAVWNVGVQTGANQTFRLCGLGSDLTEIKFTGTGTLIKHGFTGAVAASGKFQIEDLRITPAAGAASACGFNVRFSGTQPAWCHLINNVTILARDTTSYFTNVTITRNIKRGLDWRNFIVYGRNFFILGSDAHVFPSNVSSDPDCPPGQANTDAGDSYNFDNCMTVGYNYGWMFDWTGWTDTEHSHEQGHWKNCQSYSGKGMIKALNTNYAYAPADNWIIDTPGWQGIGPAFDFENCEQIRIRDGLLVADATSTNNITRCGQLVNCKDTIIADNEIYAEGTWTGGNLWAVGGASTENVRLFDNMTAHYATSLAEWLFIAATVPARQVFERGSTFRGTGAYSVAKINDASQSACETRVKDIVEALAGTSWSWDMGADGCTIFRNAYADTTDTSGNISITLPTGLFRTIRNVTATNGSTSVNSPIAVGSATITTVPLRFTALSSATPVVASIEVHGR